MSCARPRIYADFNGLMDSPRVPSRSMAPLDTWGSLRDLSNAGIRLHEGFELVIRDASDAIEDIEADAIAYYDTSRKWWFAEIDGEHRYVPAKDRSLVTRFLCLDCRADLGPEILVPVQSHLDSCPNCGLSILTAIAAPG